MTTLNVTRRFRGPSASANGGYVCGRIAALAGAPVTVRLFSPPPLDTALDVVRHDDGGIEVRHGSTRVAAARPGDVGGLAVPEAVSWSEAVAAAARFAGFERHPAPECFVCGPMRDTGDALRIFAGRAAGDVVAAPWVPDASLDAGDGSVAGEFVWAALDCPGYAAAAPDVRPMLLGELTVRVDRRIDIGERCVVLGWPISSAGRKHEVGTALYGASGDRAGLGRAIWIEPRALQ